MTNIELKRLRSIWYSKKSKVSFEQFLIWYNAQPKKCSYCGIDEKQIEILLENNLLSTKRIKTRGRKLELDRKMPEYSYNSLDNLGLSCYWCNNAKTDSFSSKEFVSIGNAISNIWKEKLKELERIKK